MVRSYAVAGTELAESRPFPTPAANRSLEEVGMRRRSKQPKPMKPEHPMARRPPGHDRKIMGRAIIRDDGGSIPRCIEKSRIKRQ